MAGKYITKQQVKLYMDIRKDNILTQAVSAAKAGISERSARTIDKGQHHTQNPKKIRAYKTRRSPLNDVWDNTLKPMLEENPDLQAKTLFIHLSRTFTDSSGQPVYDESILRTLQRYVATWKAAHGKPKTNIMFLQNHVPGQQALSDFTHMDRSDIIINGHIFKHMLYHFRLVYSKWSYVKVIQSGESFQALSEGLQEALLHLGGSPKEHRTDSLSAAYKNLDEDSRKDVTERYEALCTHYQMTPTRNNRGESHENGSVESSHGHLKNRIAQELILRGNNQFESIVEYEEWIQNIVLNSNRRNSRNFSTEQQALQPLPAHKTMDYELVSIKISKLSVMIVKNMTYSVPSRLAGHTITLHLYQHVIEGYLGSSKVLSITRRYPNQQSTRYVIDYHHVIHALIRKPRAFRFCKYRNELLPSDDYRKIWLHLDRTESKDVAPKIMLRLLKLAADYDCEHALSDYVVALIQKEQAINIEEIERDFNHSNPKLPTIDCQQHSLAQYNSCIPQVTHYAQEVSHAVA